MTHDCLSTDRSRAPSARRVPGPTPCSKKKVQHSQDQQAVTATTATACRLVKSSKSRLMLVQILRQLVVTVAVVTVCWSQRHPTCHFRNRSLYHSLVFILSNTHTGTFRRVRLQNYVCSTQAGSWSVDFRPCCFFSLTGFQTGSGQTWFSQKGHKSVTLCHIWFKCAHVDVVCHIWQILLHHFTYIFLWMFMRGNCDTSAMTPFVLTPSGSCQLSLPRRRGVTALPTDPRFRYGHLAQDSRIPRFVQPLNFVAQWRRISSVWSRTRTRWRPSRTRWRRQTSCEARFYDAFFADFTAPELPNFPTFEIVLNLGYVGDLLMRIVTWRPVIPNMLMEIAVSGSMLATLANLVIELVTECRRCCYRMARGEPRRTVTRRTVTLVALVTLVTDRERWGEPRRTMTLVALVTLVTDGERWLLGKSACRSTENGEKTGWRGLARLALQ